MINQKAKEFILNNYKGKTNKWLSEQTGLSVLQVMNFKKRKNLHSGLTGKFQKGNIPANKGKKWEEYMSKEAMEKARATVFRTGDKPRNQKPTGTEILRSDGYLWIKIAEPNKFREKHRVVWEQHHGKLKPYQKVTFLDGNRLNCDIDNLVLLSNRECMLINNKYKWCKDAEINRAILNTAKIELKLKEL